MSSRPGPARAEPPGPVRTCIGCRRRAGVDELVRVTAADGGRLVVGRGMPGRGAWLCRGEVQCLRLAIRRRAFARALRTTVPNVSLVTLAADLGLDLGEEPSQG
ncbi:MAG: DUF448 domain-containing protein [Acidimicrobiia bacterium]|nr:DUF448 domain-containing protein [Acidimicrobiia bacterium]